MRCVRGIFQGKFPTDKLQKRSIGQAGTQAYFDQWALALVELPHTLADDVNQHLLVWDVFEGFFNEMAGHK